MKNHSVQDGISELAQKMKRHPRLEASLRSLDEIDRMLGEFGRDKSDDRPIKRPYSSDFAPAVERWK